MKLSKKTKQKLQYLATIYPSILIREGSVLRSRSESRTTLTRINIEEVFPVEFVISDINNFLRVLNLLEDPDIEFIGDKESGYMEIRENSAIIRYRFSSPLLHDNIPANTDFAPSSVLWTANFRLEENELQNILKVSNVTGANIISFTKDKILLLKKSTEDSQKEFVYFEIDYQTKPEGNMPDDFYVRFNSDSFNLYSGTYDVELFYGGDKKPNGAKFSKDDGEVVVWLGATQVKG